MSQVGVQTKNVVSAPLAVLCFVSHSQNGGAARDCDGLLSMLTSKLPPKIFGRRNQRSLATCLVGPLGPHILIVQFSGGILSLAPNSVKGYHATGSA